MYKKPDLSIIIPFYFQVDTVIQTLNEISNQIKSIKKIIEVLIIDSNTNATMINVEKYNKKNSYLSLTILQTKNIVSKKRNFGINFAKADYIIFLDDDVVPKNGFLKKFLDISKKNNKVLTSCLVDFEEPRNSYLYYRRRKENSVKKYITNEKGINPRFATSMAFGVKRSDIIDNNLYFDEKFIGYGWEDVSYFIEAENKGLKLRIADIYVIHKESDSYQKYFKKQVLMGSWYKYFLQKHPNHARKMKLHILYKFLPLFKFCLSTLKEFGKLLEYLIKKKYPFNNFKFYIYELYFKYANILGMLSDSIKYE